MLGKVLRAAAVAAGVVAQLGWASQASAATITFDGLGGPAYTGYGASLTVGDVTFVQPNARLFVFSAGWYNTAGLASDYLNVNFGISGLQINFAAPVYSFTADVGSLTNWGLTSDPTLTFNFGSSSEALTLPYYLAGTANALISVAFNSSVPFSTITIADPTWGLVLDNFTYDTASPVPLPGALPLFGGGLAVLGLLARRRKNSAAAAA